MVALFVLALLPLVAYSAPTSRSRRSSSVQNQARWQQPCQGNSEAEGVSFSPVETTTTLKDLFTLIVSSAVEIKIEITKLMLDYVSNF